MLYSLIDATRLTSAVTIWNRPTALNLSNRSLNVQLQYWHIIMATVLRTMGNNYYMCVATASYNNFFEVYNSL